MSIESEIASQVHLRFFYSNTTETRPPQVTGNVFDYEQYDTAFKSGDLIVYSGTGIISSVTKVRTRHRKPATKFKIIYFF